MNGINTFTAEDGMKVQQEQMQDYALILKPEVYAMLETLVQTKTQEALAKVETSRIDPGYSIPRGNSIETLLRNDVLNKLRQK